MRLTDIVQDIIRTQLRTGDLAIDATAGNGHDTLGMAKAVGHSGTIYAIDIQAAAIEATKERLIQAQEQTQCNLLLGDHAEKLEALLPTLAHKVRLITFNLGYLPGSDKSIQTSAQSTLKALDTSIRLLAPDGRLLVTAYRGHEGGRDESQSVKQWVDQLNPAIWEKETREPKVSGDRIPPVLYIVSKRTDYPD